MIAEVPSDADWHVQLALAFAVVLAVLIMYRIQQRRSARPGPEEGVVDLTRANIGDHVLAMPVPGVTVPGVSEESFVKGTLHELTDDEAIIRTQDGMMIRCYPAFIIQRR